MLGKLAGIFVLYLVIRRGGMPKRISGLMDRYVDFLFVADERALLLNRIVPMIPFCSAFIATVRKWNLRRCVLYIVTGHVVKYGLLLFAGNVFYTYLGSDQASTTFCLVIIAISISAVSSYMKRKMNSDI